MGILPMIGACLDQIYTRNTQIKNLIFEVKFESVCLFDHDPVFYNKKLENALIKADNCLYIHTDIHKCLLLTQTFLSGECDFEHFAKIKFSRWPLFMQC